MSDPATLRAGAESLAAPLPPLLAEARMLARTVLLGAHGRRRAGAGDEFWQYRPAQIGDEARQVDWRRSARSDQHFVREMEWQAAQSVMLWVDGGASMQYASDAAFPTKADRANLLAMAVAILLMDGGERVALAALGTPPRIGETQLLRIAQGLTQEAVRPEYDAPVLDAMLPRSKALFLSDFLGDIDAIEAALTRAADRGVTGTLVQILDRAEESFPFDGRTIFESVGGGMRHETLRAGALRDRYLERLATRKDRLDRICRATGWRYLCHHTDHPAQSALVWIFGAMQGTA